TTVGSVFTNDSMNEKPIDIQKVIFSLLPQSTPNTFIITKDGNIIVPASTPKGRYALNYRICDNFQSPKDKNFKPVCQTATVTIVILQSVTTSTTSTTVTATTTATVVTPTIITLSDDTYTLTTTESTTTTATTVGSVFTNDRLNGKPIDIQKVIFSLLPQSTPPSFVITKDGNIIVPPHTPIGRYTLNYRICDNSQSPKDKNPKPICQTATITIVVQQSVTTSTTATSTTITVTTTPTVITLSDDTYTLTTTESVTTTATTVGSVFANDRMNGKPIDIQKVIFSLLPQSTPNTFIITKDGNIIIPPHTPIGCYALNYRICDSKNKNQKSICQTATITITILQTPVTPTVSATVETDTSSTTQSVTNQPIAMSDSATTPMNTPIRIAVLDNDTPYTASPKIVIFPTNGDAFVKEDNIILYRPRVRFIGTDYFVYELCTPHSQSCTTATVTVKVTHKVVADNAMSANGDDKNDYFHIVGIENYPDNQVTIYNRNGEKVFTISHYDNRQRVFKGVVEGKVSLPNAALLPQDTYFYLIEYYDENRQLQRQIGWLYLKR
ncbi:gliding motility-associated C-terminal domain-containing protein, partial [Capnocytophaga leadbetteri]